MAYRLPSRKTEKAHSCERAFPELLGLEDRKEGCLGEITPNRHTKIQNDLEHQILMRHWITSFANVEHDKECAPR